MDRETLSQYVSYDPETGEFVWVRNAGQRARAGAVAGSTIHLGYRVIRINRRGYAAHRLAVLAMTGELPPQGTVVDHIDCDPSNNRWSNLRIVNRSINAINSSKTKPNATGYPGVCRYGERFGASIRINGRSKRLGRFDTAKEAHEAYMAHKEKLLEAA